MYRENVENFRIVSIFGWNWLNFRNGFCPWVLKAVVSYLSPTLANVTSCRNKYTLWWVRAIIDNRREKRKNSVNTDMRRRAHVSLGACKARFVYTRSIFARFPRASAKILFEVWVHLYTRSNNNKRKIKLFLLFFQGSITLHAWWRVLCARSRCGQSIQKGLQCWHQLQRMSPNDFLRFYQP